MASAKFLALCAVALVLLSASGAQATWGGRRWAAGGAGWGSMAAAGATASAAAGASTGSDSEAAAALESGSYCDQAWLAAHPWFSAWLQQWQAVCQHLAPFGGCKHLKPCPTPKKAVPTPQAPPVAVSGARTGAEADAGGYGSAGAGATADAASEMPDMGTAGAGAGAGAGADASADGMAATFASALADGSWCSDGFAAGHPWFGQWLQQWQGVCKHFGGCKHLKPCPKPKVPAVVPAAPPAAPPAVPPAAPPVAVSGPRETGAPTPPEVPSTAAETTAGAATQAATEAAPEATTQAATEAAPEATTQAATEAAPEATTQAATEATTGAAAPGCQTIADVATADPDLSTLVAAATVAGLADQLKDPQLVATILAPTNEAFMAALAQLGLTLQQATAPENLPILRTVLTYHVVPGVAAKSTDLTDGQQLPTLNGGESITVDLSSGAPAFKPSFAEGPEAKVVAADIPACAAVIHKIDAVLLPANAITAEGAAAGAAAGATTGASATTGAGAAAETPTPTTEGGSTATSAARSSTAGGNEATTTTTGAGQADANAATAGK